MGPDRGVQPFKRTKLLLFGKMLRPKGEMQPLQPLNPPMHWLELSELIYPNMSLQLSSEVYINQTNIPIHTLPGIMLTNYKLVHQTGFPKIIHHQGC